MRYDPWQITLTGDPVEEEVLALPADMQARYLRLVDRIEVHGPASLGIPHVRHLDGKLWELRVTG